MAFYSRALNWCVRVRQRFAAWRTTRLFPWLARLRRRSTSAAMQKYYRWRDWYTNPHRRSFQRQSSREYWLSRAAWRRRWFQGASRYYRLRWKLRDQRRSMAVTRGLLRAIAPQILLALALVIGLGVLEAKVLTPIGAIDWLLATIGTGPAGTQSTERLNASSYDYVLSTLAQVAGVFIGLYFTAVSLVASTIYARVPGDVRSLVVSEKLGNIYVKIVALLAAITTLVLASNTLRYPLSLLNILLVTGLGVVSIYSFLVLAHRVFHFFDPTRLTHQVCAEVFDYVERATPDAFGWDDETFQHHAQKQAERLLETYGVPHEKWTGG